MPHWAYLRTGVKSILPPMEADPDSARRLLDTVPVRIVVLDELSTRGSASGMPRPRSRATPRPEIYQSRDGRARLYEHVR